MSLTNKIINSIDPTGIFKIAATVAEKNPKLNIEQAMEIAKEFASSGFMENLNSSQSQIKSEKDKIEMEVLSVNTTLPATNKLNNRELAMLEDFLKTYFDIKSSDRQKLEDMLYMAAMRNNINITQFIDDIKNGIICIDYLNAPSGNIFEFIKNPAYTEMGKQIIDITVGSNGGGANIGRGEWFHSICLGMNSNSSKPNVTIIKKGTGDLCHNVTGIKRFEELKWGGPDGHIHGARLDTGRSGKDVTKKFNELIDIKDKSFVPFRKSDRDKLSQEIIHKWNGIYWRAINGQDDGSLSDNKLKKKIINMCFEKLFKNSNSFIMVNYDGKFQRFYNTEEANIYYADKLDLTTFECRANQTNPIALRCYVF